ncbi:MAG: restriction endonuclease subunit S [Actinomycetota bacterium]|nr:restriction endonuclease subunit S [Actinomycetota bacterium]
MTQAIDVPTGWRPTRLKHVAVMAAGGTPSVDNPRYWTAEDDGLAWVAIADMTRESRLATTSRRVSAEGIRAARLPLGHPGTVLFAMYASLGAMAVLDVPATWNQAVLGITPRAGASVDFIRYALVNSRRDLLSLARSNTQANLNQEQVGNLRFPIPTLSVQRRIADFLDRECERIAEAVDTGRALVSRLGRTAGEFVCAVTGDLPRQRLRFGWRVIDCKHRTPEYLDQVVGTFPVISTREVRPGRLIIDADTRRVSEEDFHDLRAGGRGPDHGDIIFSRNARLGVAALVGRSQQVCIGQDVVLISRHPRPSELLAYFLNYAVADQIQLASIGSTFDRINVPVIKNLMVPSIEPTEERELVSRIDRAMAAIGRAQSSSSTLGEALIAYRSSLIHEAVTGKLDVTKVSDRQMDERLHAAAEDRLDEVPV